ELGGKLLDIETLQHLPNGFRPHARLKSVAMLLLILPVLFFAQQLLLGDGCLAWIDDHILLEIEDLLQLSQRHIKEIADATGQPLKEPHMRHWACQLNMPKAFTAHFRLNDLHTAFLADDAAMLHALVFTTVALPIFCRAENLGAEKPVAFRFKGPIIN